MNLKGFGRKVSWLNDIAGVPNTIKLLGISGVPAEIGTQCLPKTVPQRLPLGRDVQLHASYSGMASPFIYVPCRIWNITEVVKNCSLCFSGALCENELVGYR
jgi:hypothetical protein